MAFSNPQIKLFAKFLKKELGDGWRFMTPEVREAFVSARAFSIIRNQHAESVKVSDMDQLLSGMLTELGLGDADGQ
jgi:hypothetical protein